MDVLTADNCVVSAQLHHIQLLSGLRLNMDAFRNLSGKEERGKMALMLKECVRRTGDNLQQLHPVKAPQHQRRTAQDHLRKDGGLSAKITQHVEHLQGRDADTLCLRYSEKKELELELEMAGVRDEMSALENNEHIEQMLSGMKRVLRRLKMVDRHTNMITMKGKIACELSCGDELVLTELLFSNMLNEIAATENVSALPRFQNLADEIVPRFVPAVVGFSLLVFVVGISLVGISLRTEKLFGIKQGEHGSPAILVLVISCPCALGLATPRR